MSETEQTAGSEAPEAEVRDQGDDPARGGATGQSDDTTQNDDTDDEGKSA